MFSSLFNMLGYALSWMFVIGMAGTIFIAIPIAAYQLFSVLFEKDRPDELNPDIQR